MKEEYFIPENLQSQKSYNSPSGKYRIVIESYKTTSGAWNYTRGLVYNDTKLIADVKRNYCSFPYLFVEDHPNGHDYLICGEDYQGQTIIELDTGKRIDYLPDGAKKGYGFCWAHYETSPDKTLLVVEGCYWACPYETIIMDFSDPMTLPYIELENADDFIGWNGNLPLIGEIRGFRKSDMKPREELTYDEYEEVSDLETDEDPNAGWVSKIKQIDLSNRPLLMQNYLKEQLTHQYKYCYNEGPTGKLKDMIKVIKNRLGQDFTNIIDSELESLLVWAKEI